MNAQAIKNSPEFVIPELKKQFKSVAAYNAEHATSFNKWNQVCDHHLALAAKMAAATEREKMLQNSPSDNVAENTPGSDASTKVSGGELEQRYSLGDSAFDIIRSALQAGQLSGRQVNEVLQDSLTRLKKANQFDKIKYLLILIASEGGERWQRDLAQIKTYIKGVTPYEVVLREIKQVQPDGSKNKVWACNLKKQKGGRWISRPGKYWNKLTNKNEADKPAFTIEKAVKAAEKLAENCLHLREDQKLVVVADFLKASGLDDRASPLWDEILKLQQQQSEKIND